jgi:CRP-like cAMP-binding protein
MVFLSWEPGAPPGSRLPGPNGAGSSLDILYKIPHFNRGVGCFYNEKRRAMKKFIGLLSRCSLFENLQTAELEKLLDCLSPRYRQVEKNAFIFREEEAPKLVGVVLSGGVHIVRDNYWGNRLIVARLGPGDIFGEAFSLGNAPKLQVSVIAVENSELLLFSSQRLLRPCASPCAFHTLLLRNMIQDLARKNILLMKKIENLSLRTIREKLLFYLSSEARQAKSKSFEIPFKRQELADYLSVDRSALSAELGRMREEGLIDFHKNHFELR